LKDRQKVLLKKIRIRGKRPYRLLYSNKSKNLIRIQTTSVVRVCYHKGINLLHFIKHIMRKMYILTY